MMRSGLNSAMFLLLVACDQSTHEPMDMGVSDMAGADLAVPACKERPVEAVDLARTPAGQRVNPGDVGTPCVADGDCKQGMAPTCWKRTIFDRDGTLETPGGYCTSTCSKDEDCRGGNPESTNICLRIGPEGGVCLGGCQDAVTCRHPGYSCVVFGRQNGKDRAGCWPHGNLTCNPTQPTCEFPFDRSRTGACVREAYEDERGGICVATCELAESCPADPRFDNGTRCLYLDLTGGGDAFRGLLCWPNAAQPKDRGESCRFDDECVEGYQCDNAMGGTGKCEKLCHVGGKSPRCGVNQSCTQAFPTCAAGLCKAR